MQEIHESTAKVALSTAQALNITWAPLQFFARRLSCLFRRHTLNALITAEFKEEVEGHLTVTDNRTGLKYSIPIIRNSIPALSFRQITTAKNGKNPRQQFEEGLRVLDPGYRNTAVKLSNVTYM